jgi:hypothetical protein
MKKFLADARAWIEQFLKSSMQLLRTILGATGLLFVLIGVMMLGVAGLSGCAQSVRLTTWEIPVAEELKGCPGTKLPPKDEMADILELLTDAQVHSLRESMARLDCEGKNRVLVNLIEDHNRRARALDLPWYRRLF